MSDRCVTPDEEVLDVHNHVLFGLDDGCRTIEESAALAAAAKRAGHRGFIATPHIRRGMFDNDADGIRRRRDETRAVVEAQGLELYLGAEYYFDEHVLPSARKKTLLTLGEKSRFFLVEFPQLFLPPRLGDLLFEFRIAGYVPVLAHPERCKMVQDDLAGALATFTQGGALLQLDLGSLIGHYGKPAQKASTELIKRGAYHLAACDLHRPDDVEKIVKPSLEELRRLLSKRKKEQGVETLVEHNPRRVLANAPLEEIAPV